ncbi:flagellar hook-length control protein FliK [Modicisalibacter xianhensis]|uniref:Hook-length control protein FliK n=1 Tax=Modicisalibacter xianhensis TaxID=442341 RepID=A0A1I3A3V9_9GAMM|nr:flagellar hook-length control protein FliK [Halomonas xianhensis]SFH44566.1 hook-length control protein FliK [Halomonas xianhensis]
MSGIITPILDTLLHEVLGKRVETQAHREMLEPVKPLSQGHAPRAVHSDSRLNAEQAALQRQSAIGDRPSALPGSDSSSLAPASTRTHFSAAARSIADILVKFPAPPSVVKSTAPLAAAGESVEPAQLASRLRQSIETSGLFYESHLARWHRGDMARSLLEREPQMQFFLQRPQPSASSMPVEGQDRGLLAGSRLELGGAPGRIQPQVPPHAQSPLVYTSSSSAPAVMQGAQVPAAPGESQPAQGQTANLADDAMQESPRPSISGSDGRADDALQGIVRHQLELMVTPTLRWEGDLWSGMFMALAIHVPEAMDRQGGKGGEPSGEGNDDEEAVWHSQLTLQLPRLGTLGVNVYLRESSLNMTLECADTASLATLQAASQDLETRLGRCGLSDIKVSILPRREASEGDAP